MAKCKFRLGCILAPRIELELELKFYKIREFGRILKMVIPILLLGKNIELL